MCKNLMRIWLYVAVCLERSYGLVSSKGLERYLKIYTELTHWGRVAHICVSKLTIIGSYSGLSPGRRQTIIWPNAGILLIRTLGTNFSENQYISIQEKCNWKYRL